MSVFWDAGSRSIRAAMSACSVSGIRSTWPSSPCTSMRTVSSRKSGFPSVLSSTSSRSSGVSGVSAVSADASSSASPRPSGSSSIESARVRPPPHDGCWSSSSGRARQRISSGASRTQPARCSMSSSSGSSAQWMSSNPSTSGCLAGEPLGPLAHRPLDLLLAALVVERVEHARGEPEQVGDLLVLAEDHQLLLRLGAVVVVGDPGGGLHHLGERPVGDALAVREAAPDEHRRALERGDELAREPALAHAGLAVERDEVGAAVADGALVRVAEQLELALAADERRPVAALDAALRRARRRARPAAARRGRAAPGGRPTRTRPRRTRAGTRRGRRGSRSSPPPARGGRRR